MPIMDHDQEKTGNLLGSSNKDKPICVLGSEEAVSTADQLRMIRQQIEAIAFRLDNLNAHLADTSLKILEAIYSKL